MVFSLQVFQPNVMHFHTSDVCYIPRLSVRPYVQLLIILISVKITNYKPAHNALLSCLLSHNPSSVQMCCCGGSGGRRSSSDSSCSSRSSITSNGSVITATEQLQLSRQALKIHKNLTTTMIM